MSTHLPSAVAKSVKEPNAALIADAAARQGLTVKPLAPNMFSVEGRGRKEIFNFTMASSISHIAKTITWNKSLTKRFFKKHGVSTPEGITFSRAHIDHAVTYLRKSNASRFVLKPEGGVLGKFVFLGVRSEHELRHKLALIPGRYKRLILEEQAIGLEARYVVVGDKVVAVAERQPANVVSDGTNSIEHLVRAKNKGREGHPGLEQIVVDQESTDLLEEQGFAIDSVPEAGNIVLLKRVSNISQGGDSIDITDEVHDEIKQLAIAALKSIPTLSYAGIDIIAEDHRSALGDQKAVVLEVNWHPMIRIHHAPAQGKERDVAGEIIKHLFPD